MPYKIKLVMIVKVHKAVSDKLTKIMIERGLSVNKLASISCLTQSTVDSLVNGKSKNPKLLTIVRICDGLNIKLCEFFNDDLFNEIDRED